MDDLDIQPPAAPGVTPKKKKGFFASLFHKDVDDVRVTEDSFSQEMDLDDIRRKAGIEKPLPEPSAPEPIIEDNSFPEFDNPPTETELVTAAEEESPVQPTTQSTSKPTTQPTIPSPMEEPAIEDLARVDETTDTIPGDVELELAELEKEHEEWLAGGSEESETATQPTPTSTPTPTWTETEDDTTQQTTSTWASDVASEPTTTSPSELSLSDSQPAKSSQSKAPEKAPAHHEVIEKALQPIANKHKKIDAELTKAAKEIRADIPDWKYQHEEVKPNDYFKLKNGQDVKSFKDLLEALSFIDDETFQHHVTEDRNDFAEWVQHILQEEKLAERIRNKKAREELLNILRAHEEKVWKRIVTESKKLQGKTKKQTAAATKMQALEKKMQKLQQELEEKSAALKELRGAHTTKIKQHIDEHVADKVDEEKTELHLNKEAVTKQQAELNALEKTVRERESALDEQERSLTEEREAFEKERAEAQELLASVTDIRAEKEAAEKERAKAQELLEKNESVLKEINKRGGIVKRSESALENKREKFAEREKAVVELEQRVAAREKTVQKAEADAEQRVTKADEKHVKIQKEQEDWQATKKKELADIAERRKEVEAMIKDARTRTQEYEELVQEHERNMTRNEEVLRETEELRNEIRQRQEAMESQSMQEYLRTKVDATVAGGVTSTIAPPVEEISNLHLYKLIDQCKNALGKNSLGEARHVYNQLREEFSQSKLSSHEKSVLYNSIRELYDDIHLAMLNQ